MLLLNHRLALAAVATGTLAFAVAPTASAHPGSDPRPKHQWMRTLTEQVIAPFQVAVNRGEVYVADGATSTVSKLTNGSLTTLAKGPTPGDVAGLAVVGGGKAIAYTTTDYTTGKATLTIENRDTADVVVDLSAYEKSKNPDGGVTYGLGPGASQCAKDAVEKLTGGPATYTGIVESHPYAVASLGKGAWAVADAGGNDVLRVDARGNISTIAVLPAQPLTITAEMATAMGAPDCLVGQTYTFEPVPTDVEVGHHGELWVTTLPGGPEGPSLGARGSLYTVQIGDGSAQRVATGFLGATNVAVTQDHTAYVTELFGGKISMVSNTGVVSTFAAITSPLSVEVAGGFLYVGTMAPMDPQTGRPSGHGSVVELRR